MESACWEGSIHASTEKVIAGAESFDFDYSGLSLQGARYREHPFKRNNFEIPVLALIYVKIYMEQFDPTCSLQ